MTDGPRTCAGCSEPAPFASVTLTILEDTEHYHMACWIEFLQTHTPPSEGEVAPLFPSSSVPGA